MALVLPGGWSPAPQRASPQHSFPTPLTNTPQLQHSWKTDAVLAYREQQSLPRCEGISGPWKRHDRSGTTKEEAVGNWSAAKCLAKRPRPHRGRIEADQAEITFPSVGGNIWELSKHMLLQMRVSQSDTASRVLGLSLAVGEFVY